MKKMKKMNLMIKKTWFKVVWTSVKVSIGMMAIRGHWIESGEVLKTICRGSISVKRISTDQSVERMKIRPNRIESGEVSVERMKTRRDRIESGEVSDGRMTIRCHRIESEVLKSFCCGWERMWPESLPSTIKTISEKRILIEMKI